MKQGYQAEQITVITMYSGQESLLTRIASNQYQHKFKELKITSVDSFQGMRLYYTIHNIHQIYFVF